MFKKDIKKILIANRGEIACRIIKTCKNLGILTVAVYSDIDQNALFVSLADEAVHIGSSLASESYLNIEEIIKAAYRYGFLSENPQFHQRISESSQNYSSYDLIFIGPSPESMLAIGDKIKAKNLLSKHLPSVPLIPGYNGDDQSLKILTEEAKRIGFPILLKASAGGGGKGMRIVHEESKLSEEIELAKSESLRSFGSDQLLIEKYFDSIRHIEIQIIGDQYGNVYHCFERECSIQRRHQKVIEETPSPYLDQALREQMIETAIQISKFLNYIGDEKEKRFYFLEMNTRLQVEHPITELVTGLDLGHSIECRLYSEDPGNNFLPSTGKIRYWKQCTTPFIRYDTGIETVWAPTRQQALQKMSYALCNTVCLGLITNQSFLSKIFCHQNFLSGNYNTHFIENHYPPNYLKSFKEENDLSKNLIIIPFLWFWYLREKSRSTLKHIPSSWRYIKWKNPRDIYLLENGNVEELTYEYQSNIDGGKIRKIGNNHQEYYFKVQNHDVILNYIKLHNDNNNNHNGNEIYGNLRCTIDKEQRSFEVANGNKDHLQQQEVYVHDYQNSIQYKFIRKNKLITSVENVDDDISPYLAPMPCKILKVLIPSGTNVIKKQPILTMESMKTEVKLYSNHDGIIKILVKEGNIVSAGTLLVKIE
ncbi:6162_t:CDS:10 [Diversispora eburnea]|uniref:6162_t:CDS:1 n=1 Tax=Diversispora eburnea TaxID=1213867 RepID=A0A9N8Z9G1_9GLOM|nr:6162_t:CDS:10 [Diversispora eburnea]